MDPSDISLLYELRDRNASHLEFSRSIYNQALRDQQAINNLIAKANAVTPKQEKGVFSFLSSSNKNPPKQSKTDHHGQPSSISPGLHFCPTCTTTFSYPITSLQPPYQPLLTYQATGATPPYTSASTHTHQPTTMMMTTSPTTTTTSGFSTPFRIENPFRSTPSPPPPPPAPAPLRAHVVVDPNLNVKVASRFNEMARVVDSGRSQPVRHMIIMVREASRSYNTGEFVNQVLKDSQLQFDIHSKVAAVFFRMGATLTSNDHQIMSDLPVHVEVLNAMFDLADGDEPIVPVEQNMEVIRHLEKYFSV
eukprot:TRINITY_DN2410_c0_g2_i2.p1 TRINITY_DN2410_c0_g2~~TRINITY_DN2410_c0_g2_i2.p1  ORF type:complete len:306 (+),score=34.45 TRINITY_DN2410_c0_g2_i2:110-1027(+)